MRSDAQSGSQQRLVSFRSRDLDKARNQEIGRWVAVPVIRKVNAIDVWEHTPAAYYSHGEYPRHLRPVGPRLGDHDVRWEWVAAGDALTAAEKEANAENQATASAKPNSCDR